MIGVYREKMCGDTPKIDKCGVWESDFFVYTPTSDHEFGIYGKSGCK